MKTAIFGASIALAVHCGGKQASPADNSEINTGGTLVATTRSEPASFNRFVSARSAEELVSLLTHATLVRVNRVTGALEPRLAREWTSSPDGLTWTLKLREGVMFSDAAPFTSADVLFSLQAVYDKSVASPLAGNLQVNDQPLAMRALDERTVVVTFPAAFGPGLSVLDALPILPSHKLAASLRAGQFAKAWPLTTPPADLAGLGPFMINEYKPGERLLLVRNPHFWLKDEQGRQLPYVDRIELQIVPEQNAELLRLQSGNADLTTSEVRPEDLAALKPIESKGGLSLVQAGVGISPDALWINLAPNAAAGQGRSWLRRAELRQALNAAIDRQEIVNTVYLGAAEPANGPVTSGWGVWYLPDLPKAEHDAARAKSLLAAIGLSDRTGDGMLEDAAGKPARFSILTQKGHTLRERTVAVVQEQLRRVGLAIDVVAVDQGALFQHYMARDYDAMYFVASSNSIDPARNPEFWLSSGSFHYWNPGQKTPATPWEAKIDDLMRQQSTTLDAPARQRIFAEAQRLFAKELPALFLVAPKVTIAMSSRVHGATPSVLAPPVLWNAEKLSVSTALASSRR
jgi:peptide/nickel transport system substrate-binding protein